MKMPERVEWFFQLIGSLPEPVKAALMSFVIGLMVSYANKDDDRTTLQCVPEVLMGAFLTWGGGVVVQSLGYSGGWSYALGYVFAWFGVKKTKEWIGRLVEGHFFK